MGEFVPSFSFRVPLARMGLRYIAATPSVAVFGLGAWQDATAAPDVDAMVRASRHPLSTRKIYTGWEHGAALFERDPDLKPNVSRWALDVLGR